MTNYGTSQPATVTVPSGSHATQDFVVRTGRLAVTPTSLSFNLLVGQSSSQTLTLSNTGSLNLTWWVAESAPVAWLSESPTGGTRPAGTSEPVKVTASATGLTAGSYSATLVFSSNAGKQPNASVPVSLYVTAYDQRVDAGGPGAYDSAYAYWAADQVYASGLWGYTNQRSSTVSKKHAIALAAAGDQALYQTQRVDPGEYRFDVSAGHTYTVELLFAELKQVKVGARVFNVTIEGQTALTNFDIRKAAGDLYTAYRPPWPPCV